MPDDIEDSDFEVMNNDLVPFENNDFYEATVREPYIDDCDPLLNEPIERDDE